MPAWARSWSAGFAPGLHGTASLGRAELGHSGTLLLDRVSAASHSAQPRLLRLLETGMVERDGEGTPRRVDVRVIAITTRPLDLEVREGRFRDDLRRRLQVVRIRVPALRERRGDIALLAEHFLARHGAPRVPLSAAAGHRALRLRRSPHRPVAGTLLSRRQPHRGRAVARHWPRDLLPLVARGRTRR
jgi:DNA-binding NtrC family response regulator